MPFVEKEDWDKIIARMWEGKDRQVSAVDSNSSSSSDIQSYSDETEPSGRLQTSPPDLASQLITVASSSDEGSWEADGASEGGRGGGKRRGCGLGGVSTERRRRGGLKLHHSSTPTKHHRYQVGWVVVVLKFYRYSTAILHGITFEVGK